MNLGIDVGGTFTDGVIIENGNVLSFTKKRTHEDITLSIEEVLVELIQNIEIKELKRIVLSTTIITNIIAQAKYKNVGIIAIPGPGVNPHSLSFAAETVMIQGCVDYRGRQLQSVDLNEVNKAVDYYYNKGIHNIVIACKFSQRNTSIENEIKNYIKKKHPSINTLASHKVSGLLNWVRRTNGACFTLAVKEEYQLFRDKVNTVLKKLNISCPTYILKADGGTLPLEISQRFPLEAVFSGPAASAMGAIASASKDITSVMMDIGGTTTDIGIILNGKALLAEKGTYLKGYPIPIKALALSSLPLGGDTSINIIDKNIILGERKGPAFCLGGPNITVTDVLVYKEYSNIAGKTAVDKEISSYSNQLNITPDSFCDKVLNIFINELEVNINEMFRRWEEEPAYRIWQLLANTLHRPNAIVCLGGPADGLGKVMSESNKWTIMIPPYAKIANAVGAALSKTTLRLEMLADTQQGTYATNIGGVQGKIETDLSNLVQAKAFAKKLYEDISKTWNIADDNEPQVIYEEGFNIVREWHKAGTIYQICLQSPTGLEGYLTEVRHGGFEDE